MDILNNKTLDYLNNLNNEAFNNVGLFMSIGGGSTILIVGLLLLILNFILDGYGDYLINKINIYNFNKSNYKKELNNFISNKDSINLNNQKFDKPIFKNKNYFLSFLSTIRLDKYLKNDLNYILFYFSMVIIFAGVLIGLHNSESFDEYFEENLNETYLSDYTNSYDVKSINFLNDSDNDSYYVILYKNGDDFKKYNYYGDIKASKNDVNLIKFYNSKLMDDIDKAIKEDKLKIDFSLYYLLDDKYFHSLEVSENLINK